MKVNIILLKKEILIFKMKTKSKNFIIQQIIIINKINRKNTNRDMNLKIIKKIHQLDNLLNQINIIWKNFIQTTY